MDSLSQFVLGAAVAEVALGKQLGRKALLLGGVLGTLPDLDVIFPMGGAIADYSYHRSWSHSWLVHAAVSLPFAWVLRGVVRGVSLKQFSAAIFAIFFTHAALDACTIYGTQLFWPLASPPVGTGSVFIIDLLYTLPLLIGVIGAWFLRDPARARRWNRRGLVLSSAYLLWSIFAQQIIRSAAEQDLAKRGIEADSLMVTAAPFNTLLWRIVAIDGDRYLEGFDSLLDGAAPQWQEYPRRLDEVSEFSSSWAVQRVDWFTQGKWAASSDEAGLYLSDLRMGVEPNYVFRFRIATPGPDGGWELQRDTLESLRFRGDTLAWVYSRIFAPSPKPGESRPPLPTIEER